MKRTCLFNQLIIKVPLILMFTFKHWGPDKSNLGNTGLRKQLDSLSVLLLGSESYLTCISWLFTTKMWQKWHKKFIEFVLFAHTIYKRFIVSCENKSLLSRFQYFEVLLNVFQKKYFGDSWMFRVLETFSFSVRSLKNLSFRAIFICNILFKFSIVRAVIENIIIM